MIKAIIYIVRSHAIINLLMGEWTNVQMDGQMIRWMEQQTDGKGNRQTESQADRQQDRHSDRRKDERADRLLERWLITNGWRNETTDSIVKKRLVTLRVGDYRLISLSALSTGDK